MHILIVDCDPIASMQLGSYLEERGHSTDYASYETLAWRLVEAHHFDAIVACDRRRMDGLALCRRLRQSSSRPPIILIAGEDASVDQIVAAFETGADDCLVRPVAFAEIHARLNALTRRRRVRHHDRLVIADLELDVKALEAWRGGRRLELSPTEFKLLRILMEAAPETVTYNELELCLWGKNRGHLLGTNVRSQVYNLRRVVDQPFAQSLIQTRRALGYRMTVPDGAPGLLPYQRRKRASTATEAADTSLRCSSAQRAG